MRRSTTSRTTDGSHHWYWVAAVPATFALWLAALAWLAVAASVEAFAFGSRMVEVSMVALGLPFAFLTAYLPVAVYRDARYVDRTSAAWAPDPTRQAAFALAGLVVLVALVAWVVVFGGFHPMWAVIAGFVASVPFASLYLYRRREHVGVPDVPWR